MSELRIEDAVILAAGRGRRMGELTEKLPKPLVPVSGQPMLVHILRGMADAGISRAHLVIGYRGDLIEEAFRDLDLGLEVAFYTQQEARGTANALLAAEGGPQGPFLLSWGDIMLPSVDYRAVCETFEAAECEVALGVNRVDDPFEGAAVYVTDAGLVERIVEKPARGTSTTPFNNSGLFALPIDIFDAARAVVPSPRGELELPSALDALMKGGRRFRAVELEGWTHVGTPEELARAEDEGSV